MSRYPHLLKEVGAELFASKRFELALQYLELYRNLNRAAAAELGGYETQEGAAADDDAEALVLQGKCNLELHNHAAAEECFLAAIDADDENIDARFELAKMYETAQEKEQAYILVNEALSLEAAQQKRQQEEEEEEGESDDGEGQDTVLPSAGPARAATTEGAPQPGKRRGHTLETAAYRVFLDSEGNVVRRRRKFRKGPDGQEILISRERKKQQRAGGKAAAGVGRRGGQRGAEGREDGDNADDADGLLLRRRSAPRRARGDGQHRPAHRALRGYARRLFASPAEQADFEAATSARLRARYRLCQQVKERADAGDADAAAAWMDAAQELIDDFRSFRAFYTWDTYVQFLGVNNLLHDRGSGEGVGGGAFSGGQQAPAQAIPGQHSSDLTALAERLQQSMSRCCSSCSSCSSYFR